MSWLPSLDRKSSNIEENLDIGDLDLAEVVLKYQTAEDEVRQSRLFQEAASARQLKTAGRRSRRGKRAASPPLSSKAAKKRSLVNGIPEGVAAEEYIKYRKCLYMDTVREWRGQLSEALSAPVLDELQQLLTRLFRLGIPNCRISVTILVFQLFLYIGCGITNLWLLGTVPSKY